MEKFTSSFGSEVYMEGGALYIGNPPLSPLTRAGVQALREFFQYERDQELGRWRCPENPNYVVYPKSDNPRYVKVLNESDGLTDAVHAESPEIEGRESHRVASAYFAAHPAPKPWHDAKPGEVWELTYGGCPTAHVFTNQHSKHPGFAFVADRAIVNPDDPDITSGRRIWPEVEWDENTD